MGGAIATSSKTLGRYELICEVAKGQLGSLWAAHASGTEDAPPVLVRRVPTASPTTADEIDSLSEGAWWMLELQVPGIARGIDLVKTEGELGVVTEFFDGEVLRSLLRLASFKRRPLSMNVTVRIALDVLEGLSRAVAEAGPAAAGEPGFAFGGLVPDSVLVGKDGHSRLLDIGIVGPAARVGTIARHPEMAAYAAPEQLDDPAATDVRANLYSVGVMVWEMLAGKRMFVGSTHQAVVEKVKAGGVQRLDASKPVGGDAIPAALADVVVKLLSGSRDERYATIQETIDALKGAAEPATHEQVAALVEDFAGNAIGSRRKLIDKALSPAPASVKAVPAPAKAAAAPSRERKATLLGISPPAAPKVTTKAEEAKPEPPRVLPPPPARPPLESLDSEFLEPESSEGAPAFTTSEAPTQPTPPAQAQELVAATAAESGEKKEEGEAIKTQFLGMAPDPSAAIAQAEAEGKGESPKPPDASPQPPAAESPKPPAAEAPKASAAESPKPPAADVPPPPAFVTGAEGEAPSAEAEKGDLDVDVDAGGDEKSADEAEEPEEKPGKKDSAVAWVSPPGAALEPAEAEAAPLSAVEINRKRNQKVVFGIVGGIVALMLVGIVISKSGSKDESTDTSTGSSATAVRTAEPPKEEPKAEEPKAEEPKAEEPKAEEPKAEEPKAEEPKAEEPKAEEPKPEPKPVVQKPVVSKPTTTKPTTTKPTTTKPVTKPVTKPKPKYTPSGI